MRKASKGEILQRIGGLGSAANKSPLNRERRGSTPPPPASPESMGSSLDAAYAIVARLVVRQLQKLPSASASLFELLDPLDTTSEDLIPVVRWMADRRYLEVLESRRNGDWLVRTTEQAKSLF